MTMEQITAINNGMSMLTGLYFVAGMVTSIKEFTEYTDKHIKAMKDSGVDSYIVEHFESLCLSFLPTAEHSVKEYLNYDRMSKMDNDM